MAWSGPRSIYRPMWTAFLTIRSATTALQTRSHGRSTSRSIKLNVAVGGSWGGYMGVDDSIFPAEYIIDYVRVYQR